MSGMAFRLIRCHLPRMASKPGMASTAAAMPMRAATAEPEDQPASVRDRANDPEVAKVAAESKAKLNPAADLVCISPPVTSEEIGNPLQCL
jgi:hypothetical protein